MAWRGKKTTVTILPVQSEEQIQAVWELLQEMAASPGVTVTHWALDQELAELPGVYAPPNGRLLLAVEDGENVGCVALRPLGGGLCQLTKIYVRPAHRNRGIGRRLIEAVIEVARTIGYEKLRLDTEITMTKLFRSFGFDATNHYWQESVPEGAEWMIGDAFVYELALRR